MSDGLRHREPVGAATPEADPSAGVSAGRVDRAWGLWLRGLTGLVLLPLALVTQRLLAEHPGWVERHYTAGLYPKVVDGLQALWGWLPFSMAEFLVSLLILFALRGLVRGMLGWRRAQPGERRILATLLRWVSWWWAGVGLTALSFLLLWGLNYARVPLDERVGWRLTDIQPEELLELCVELGEHVGELRPQCAEDEQGVLRLAAGRQAFLDRAEAGFREARRRWPWLEGRVVRPRLAFLSHAMSRLGISGIYSPFTGEPHVNAELSDAELPFAAMHEMAHGLGFAREDEANLVAHLVCRVHPDPDVRYAGHLEALLYALGALRGAGLGEQAAQLVAELPDGARRDLQRIDERVSAMRSVVSRVSGRVNDAYLRAQGDARGTRSYGRMVQLMIGERRARRGT